MKPMGDGFDELVSDVCHWAWALYSDWEYAYHSLSKEDAREYFADSATTVPAAAFIDRITTAYEDGLDEYYLQPFPSEEAIEERLEKELGEEYHFDLRTYMFPAENGAAFTAKERARFQAWEISCMFLLQDIEDRVPDWADAFRQTVEINRLGSVFATSPTAYQAFETLGVQPDTASRPDNATRPVTTTPFDDLSL